MFETPLHDWHAANGGRMVDFAGWSMPVQYTTITEEHLAVRGGAGLFDISHMGRLWFQGPEATAFLDSIVTCNVSKIQTGQIRYGLVTNEAGGILDDVLVYHLGEGDAPWLVVVNASNREKILDWIASRASGMNVQWEDRTKSEAMIALQGPRAEAVVAAHVSSELSSLKYYRVTQCAWREHAMVVSRTGYTGEDGFELIVPSSTAGELWSTLLEAADDVRAAGLGARDTLRLEAAMPLYGHELDEDIDPFMAGLSFAVSMDGADFAGKASLDSFRSETGRRHRVGLRVEGRRVAREGAEAFRGDDCVGRVTSGTHSPTLEAPIAMAYVDANVQVGDRLDVDIRGRRTTAEVVELPFYRRAK